MNETFILWKINEEQKERREKRRTYVSRYNKVNKAIWIKKSLNRCILPFCAIHVQSAVYTRSVTVREKRIKFRYNFKKPWYADSLSLSLFSLAVTICVKRGGKAPLSGASQFHKHDEHANQVSRIYLFSQGSFPPCNSRENDQRSGSKYNNF